MTHPLFLFISMLICSCGRVMNMCNLMDRTEKHTIYSSNYNFSSNISIFFNALNGWLAITMSYTGNTQIFTQLKYLIQIWSKNKHWENFPWLEIFWLLHNSPTFLVFYSNPNQDSIQTNSIYNIPQGWAYSCIM